MTFIYSNTIIISYLRQGGYVFAFLLFYFTTVTEKVVDEFR